MVKDMIAVIHDCIKKSHVIFLTNYIKRGLVWWKETLWLFDGPGYHWLQSQQSFQANQSPVEYNNAWLGCDVPARSSVCVLSFFAAHITASENY